MNEKYTYLLVELSCIAVPLISSFHPKIQFFVAWKSLMVAILGMMALFIPADILFTHWGVWGFQEKYTLGIFFFNLPIEEYLFFICIPYASVFTYYCLRKLLPASRTYNMFTSIAWVYLFLNLFIAITFYYRIYTFTYHLFAAILLAWHLVWRKSNYIGLFTFTYSLILIPFILSNGVLTGLAFWKYPLLNVHPELINSCIVWYDDLENLGIRLFSIPLDDIAYGCSMLLTSVTLFEAMEARKIASIQLTKK